MHSAPKPKASCTSKCGFWWTEFHTQSAHSPSVILSKIPSQPKMMKSCCFVSLKLLISGAQTTTFGFPPFEGSFASTSPKVRLTDSLPGKTRIGPMMISGGALSSPDEATVAVW